MVGWLITAAWFGTFTAFYFWIDAAFVRGRAGAPFPERRAAFRTAGGAAALAAVGTLAFVPVTFFVLLALGSTNVPGTGEISLVTAALVFIASVAGGFACFRARLRLTRRAASGVSFL